MFDIIFSAAFTSNYYRFITIDRCDITKTLSIILQDTDLYDLDDKLVYGYRDIPEDVLDWLDTLPGETLDGWTVCVMNASDLL